ncbi:MAG: hypothetical protein U0625_06965 [Phycisphaerales bacterium]
MKQGAPAFGLLLGIIITPFALLLAVVSAGAGHGDYVLAKLLFPFTMLSSLVFRSITVPFILLAVVQFPFYGWIVAAGSQSSTRRRHLWILAGIHLAGVTLNFVVPYPGFS